jgi:subtilisin family serine protease
VKTGICASAAMLALIAGSTVIASDIAWKNADQAGIQAAEMFESPQRVFERHAGQEHRVIARFAAVPTPEQRAALKAAGVEVLAPLGGSSYFVRLSEDARAQSAIRAGGIESMGEIRREHKLDAKLLGAEAPAWALAQPASLEAEGVDPNPLIGVYVQLHRDVTIAGQTVAELVADHGGVIRDKIESINSLVVEMPFLAVEGLASDDCVQWVEPALPRMGTFNAGNRVRVQADTAHAAPYNLDGSGVTVLVYDGGTVRTTHQDYSGRATLIDGDSQSYHATHVAGTVGGDGTANPTHRGMAPGVTILSAGFEYDGSGTFLYTNPGDIEFDYANGLSQGAVISNNSIGSNIAPNGFPCSYEGDYGLTAATIDAIIGGSLGDDIVIFWAAGNERGSGSCGSLYNTSPPPGNNKNAITVGALNSNDDSVTSFTSFGPSDDGRIRPVISAPGCQTGGDGGITSLDNDFDTDYTTLCGTSMASPTAAGVGALIFEDFRATFPGQGDPSNQLMKTWLCQTAVDLFNAGPDNRTGYGSIRAVDAIEFMRTGNWDEGTVFDGGVTTYTIDVQPGDPELKITLAWDDVPGTPNISPALVNDLDLVVIDPSGTRHYPWTIPFGSPGSPAVKTAEDHLNNIEQVQVDNPQAGRWMIEIVGHSVPEGPQGFAVSATPALGDGLLAVGLVSDVPDLLAPATPLEVRAAITPGIDALVSGSVTLHYRLDGGSFASVPMNDEGFGDYLSTIPGAACDEAIEFFVTAEGEQAGAVRVPPGSGAFAVPIGELEIALVDNMETDTGWTVSGDATDGQWTRGVPVDCSTRGAPGVDADGSGQAWLTDNSAASSCNSDVDNGTTTLTSPAYDLTAGLYEVSYRYWFADIGSGSLNGDEWAVDVSTDNGASWDRARTVTTASASWRLDTITVGPGGEYPGSSAVRLRFSANDVGTQNVVEAGLDDLRIIRAFCDDVACPADLAAPFGVLDLADVQAFVGGFVGQEPIADLAAPFGVWDLADVQTFVTSFTAGCP